MRRLIAFALFAVPLTAFALDFSDYTARYTDAPFAREEAAAISLLTSLKAVEGNPDGTFAPKRTLNRAEFLKIALNSRPSVLVIASDAGNCFPDVRVADWFSMYVCLSKIRGIVAGYPDGFFHPERPVNYAEAVKMLVKIYGYDADPPGEGEQWYAPFVDIAREHKVLLPTSKELGVPLTRGEMARLAAAFAADGEGELALYRQAERGGRPINVSSVAAVSSVPSVASSSVSSVSPVSSASPVSPVTFPAQSSLLLIGRMTPLIFDATFEAAEEDGNLRTVRIEFAREIKSIKKLYVVDGTGRELGSMTLDIVDNNNKTKWYLEVGTGTLLLRVKQGQTLGIKALLFDRGAGGGSKEMFEVANASSFSIGIQGVQSQTVRQLFPISQHVPYSETAQAKLTLARNMLGERGTLHAGKNRVIASYAFSGTALPGAQLAIDAVTFHMETHGVQVTNWRIGGMTEVEWQPCGVDADDRKLIICSSIPEAFRAVGGRPLSLIGDVVIENGAPIPAIQMHLMNRGRIGVNGDVWWSDGVGSFRWVEDSALYESGPKWTVEQ